MKSKIYDYIKINKLQSYPTNRTTSRPVNFSSFQTNLSVCIGSVLHRVAQWVKEDCLQTCQCIQTTLHSRKKTACSYFGLGSTWPFPTPACRDSLQSKLQLGSPVSVRHSWSTISLTQYLWTTVTCMGCMVRREGISGKQRLPWKQTGACGYN